MGSPAGKPTIASIDGLGARKQRGQRLKSASTSDPYSAAATASRAREISRRAEPPFRGQPAPGGRGEGEAAPGTLAVLHPGALAGHRSEKEARHWLQGHGDDRGAIDGEGHERVEVVAAGDEVTGAIEGIDHPAPAVRQSSRVVHPSSLRTASPGKASRMVVRITPSAARSADVTGVPSGLIETS